METKNMSVPHSVVHAASYDEVEKHPGTTAAAPPKEKGKGMVSRMMIAKPSVASMDIIGE
jgi:hypothetical protein